MGLFFDARDFVSNRVVFCGDTTDVEANRVVDNQCTLDVAKGAADEGDFVCLEDPRFCGGVIGVPEDAGEWV